MEHSYTPRYILAKKQSGEVKLEGLLCQKYFLPSPSFQSVNEVFRDLTFLCAYQGVRNVCLSENLECFVFLLPPL